MRHAYISTDEYEVEGIEIIDLTSEEIKEAVMEMELALRGEHLLSDVQLRRQEQMIQRCLK